MTSRYNPSRTRLELLAEMDTAQIEARRLFMIHEAARAVRDAQTEIVDQTHEDWWKARRKYSDLADMFLNEEVEEGEVKDAG